MRYQFYFDVDRKGNGFILNVLHTVNKKQEPIEIIMQVKHLGPINYWDYRTTYSDFEVWPRAMESGDIYRFNFTRLGVIQ